jgi:HAE1 family hydrophobic/amphiphilic exporter-1
MLILILMLFGGMSFMNLGLDMMPDLDFPILTVVTAYPGAAAEDVEQLVTRPIETAVAGIKGIEKLTSTSSENVSQVTIMFQWGSNLDVAGQDVREAINRIKNSSLPDGIIDPMVMRLDISQMPILLYGVTGMGSPTELQKYFEDAIAPRVERLEGVASMTVAGGPVREINVFLNKTRMEQYRIGPEAVMGALAAQNLNIASGHVSAGHQEYLVRTLGEFDDIESIANTIIATVGGSPIRVSDVARVEDTFKERRGHVRMNGKCGVVFIVTKQSGANTLSTVRNVRALLEELKPIMPADIEFVPILDQGETVERVTQNTTQAAVLGGLLAVIILWLFLRNWRPTFVIALAIPTSIITTFIGLDMFGYTLNVITLGGFALAVGMLIDNAIVVIENIYRHLENGEHRKVAAVKGTSEVGLAITASTLTTFAVFVPLALAGGFAGKIAQPLALTVCAGLGASLLIAMTLVPMLSSIIFKKKREKQKHSAPVAATTAIAAAHDNGDNDSVDANDKKFQNEAHGGKLFRTVQSVYEKALGWALSHRAVIVTATVVIFAVSMLGMSRLGGEFMPQGDSGMGTLKIQMPVGTNLEETNRLVATIEERVREIPEIVSVVVMIGTADESSGRGSDVNEATVYYKLKPFSERSRSSAQVTDEIRRSIPDLHGVTIEFASSMGGGGGSNPIELKFFGNEISTLKAYADSAMAILSGIDGLHDINVSMRDGKPELLIKPDRDRATMMGFTMAEIGTGIRHANLGQVVTKFREGGEEFDVRVRLDEDDRATMSQITAIPVMSRSGMVAQIGNLGEVRQGRGPISIYRENRVRCVTVSAQTDARDLQGEMEKVQAALKDMEASMPNGYFIEYGGSFEDMQKTFAELILALIIAILLIYMVMAAQFESFTQPVIVMLTVPLAFIGVVLGLTIMGHPLSVTAFIGIIILIGVVVNNGIVMVTFVNQMRDEGRSIRDAIIKGAVIRLRPILIMSTTTIIAVLPMALSKGQGSEMQSPMGTVVAFGLATSSMLTLFVVPVFYSIIDSVACGIKVWSKRVFLGEVEVKVGSEVKV